MPVLIIVLREDLAKPFRRPQQVENHLLPVRLDSVSSDVVLLVVVGHRCVQEFLDREVSFAGVRLPHCLEGIPEFATQLKS